MIAKVGHYGSFKKRDEPQQPSNKESDKTEIKEQPKVNKWQMPFDKFNPFSTYYGEDDIEDEPDIQE